MLLTEDGTPKITDFGLAKKMDEAGKRSERHHGNAVVYGAGAGGRQVEGDRAGHGCLCLGAILYECLTGRPPFKAATMMDTLLQVVQDEPVATGAVAVENAARLGNNLSQMSS